MPPRRTPIEEIQAAVKEYLAHAPDEAGNELAQELENLWYDLGEARRAALNGVWSIGCENLVRRIVRLTRLRGKPTEWDSVQMELLLDGWYEALNEAAGFPTPLTDEDRATVTKLYFENVGRHL